ncbi:RNA polymerase sigma factor [Butyrivibrio sp.]|jgi:RNA polymerase sigma-70 factor (ECF subfamily)|uniref:RNA polymerase sigma factor n=1 Tax=Butyrivibrio sp. TaxID=28121 RepID=UPI0025BC0CA3|nr:sigma-70 family RNA polymerase sigma factor [Butyrivibrio sp.]
MTWLSDKSHRKEKFEKIYRENFERVYRYAYMILLDQHDAEDVTSETFMAAFNEFDSYDANKASVITWLSRIAHNKAINLLRSSAYRERNELPQMDTKGAEDKAIENISEDVAFATLSFLSAEEREFLTYRYVFEFSNKEIAKLQGSTEDAIKMRYKRLLEKCRKKLSE